jgi:uncharacterized protein (DUF4415 family)
LEIVVNARHIVRRTLKTRKAGKTDWKRVDALTDEEIQRAVREDPDAAPIVDKAWFKMAKIVLPEPQPRKELLTLRLDRKVIDWFKVHGARYQTHMNAVLRAYVEAHEASAPKKFG